MLVAEAVDALHAANWLNSKDGQTGMNRPKPIPRPGHRPKKEDYDPLPMDEMLDWLGWEAPDDISELEELVDAEHASRGRKLTPGQVRDIRTSTDTQTALADRYGVARSTVAAVIAGRTYADVTTE